MSVTRLREDLIRDGDCTGGCEKAVDKGYAVAGVIDIEGGSQIRCGQEVDAEATVLAGFLVPVALCEALAGISASPQREASRAGPSEIVVIHDEPARAYQNTVGHRYSAACISWARVPISPSA